MDRYDEATALIVVDTQNDFADPNGSLFVKDGNRILDFVNGEIAQAREAGCLIVFTQDWHPPDTPHFQKDGGIWPVHCVGGTWGAEFVEGLDVRDEDHKVRKGVGGEDGYSGFTVQDPKTEEKQSTELESLLRSEGIQKAIVVGLATDYCVRATAIDSAKKGFDTIVLSEGIRSVDLEAGDGERAMDEMRAAGAHVE